MDSVTIGSFNHEWPPQDPSKLRKLRAILPQLYATLAIFAVTLSHEIFESAISSDLYFNNPSSTSIHVYTALAGIGLLVGGILAQIVGARALVMLAGAASVVDWITLGWVSPNALIQWVIYIVLLAKGIVQAPAYVYVAEISQPSMRNPLMALLSVTAIIEPFFFALPREISARTIAAIFNILIVLYGLVTMFILPDTPYWLASKGRYNRAELSLAWFRGRTSTENVKTEIKAIIDNVNNSPTAFKLFGRMSLYILALIVCYVFLVSAFVRLFFVTHISHISDLLGNDNYGYLIILFWIISSVYTFIAFVVLIVAVGKRMMILVSLFSGTMALLAASIFGFLRQKDTLSMDVYRWLILTCLAVAWFACVCGTVSVPLILNGELFPTKLRYFGAGFGLFFMFMVREASKHLYFAYLASSPGALLAVALVSMFVGIHLLWLFPRTENKSLVEIEHSSTSISELTRKK